MTPETQSSQRQVFHYALGIILAYMLARTCIAGGVMGAQQYNLWMTLPRLLGLGICLAIMQRRGGLRLWGWHAGYSRRGLSLMALALAGMTSLYLAEARTRHYSPAEVLAGWTLGVVAVAFEETCFRGLVYHSLRTSFGAVGAAVFSSVLFMIYHWHAQPFSSWPMIFTYGMVACCALELGTGLVWIAVAHEVIACLWFNFGSAGPGGVLQTPPFLVASFVFYGTALCLALRWQIQRSSNYQIKTKGNEEQGRGK